MNHIAPMKSFKQLSFACINGAATDLVPEFQEVFSLSKSQNWIIEETNLDLKSLYHPEPKQGGAHLPAFFLWSPRSNANTSVFFSNYTDGLSGTLRALTGCFDRQVYSTRLSGADDEFPAFFFQFFSEGDIRRVVYAKKDELKWTFFQEGVPLSVEDQSHYKKRKVSERLSEQIIASYFSKLGWDIIVASFWSAIKPGFLLKKTAWD